MNLRQELAEFTSDGCTLFVQTWRNVNLYPCCFEHDMAWYLNYPWNFWVWLQSNFRLGECFAEIHVAELSGPAVILTSTIGLILALVGLAKRKAKAP